MTTLTRKEQQARTRSELMRSASKLICERGPERASVEDIAREAGFTKGAFYSNFASKEELFLAMMDQKFAAEFKRLDDALRSDEPVEDQIRNAGIGYIRVVHADPDWPRLFTEFATLATRDEDFREEFMTRYRAMRDRITELYRRYMNELGIEEPPIPLDQIVLATFCLANGFLTEQMLDPTVEDEEYGTMIVTYFGGLGAMMEEQDPGIVERLRER